MNLFIFLSPEKINIFKQYQINTYSSSDSSIFIKSISILVLPIFKAFGPSKFISPLCEILREKLITLKKKIIKISFSKNSQGKITKFTKFH